MLAGREHVNHSEWRVFVNARQGFAAPPSDEYTIRRDYDSLLGISRSLPYISQLAVFPIPSFRETLTTSVHMAVKIQTTEGQRSVQLHKIPNILFGKLANRSQTRLFFPRLYVSGGLGRVPQPALKNLYNKVIRPTINEILPANVSHWPVSYEQAFSQAQDRQGQLHHHSVDVPGHYIQEFGREVIRRCDQDRDLKGAFFVHECRGTKDATVHNGTFEFDREESLNDLLRDYDTENMELGEWYVDVALEVHCPGHVLQWLEDGHRNVLEELFPNSSVARIDQMARSRALQVDQVAQLTDLAGFRMECPTMGRADSIIYAQIYTTDKSPTYQLHRGAFSAKSARDLYPAKIDRLRADYTKLGEVFGKCSGFGEHEAQDGNVRAEVRVRATRVLEVLHTFEDDFIQSNVIAYDDSTWW
ncbi:predicted protein [Sparassis crispa]|uniref:Uncharacterized protein n=1 Tax=Sparassis crispa TaxID=139825 RepID=A0A401H3J1_9APHY|nr:predicted protein [Sparassis crispa]GBE88997.1 predicted protein [Sparassis crispa]